MLVNRSQDVLRYAGIRWTVKIQVAQMDSQIGKEKALSLRNWKHSPLKVSIETLFIYFDPHHHHYRHRNENN